jgi:hypothetical protein
MTNQKLTALAVSSFALFAGAAVAQATGMLQHQSRPTAFQPAAHALIQPLSLNVLARVRVHADDVAATQPAVERMIGSLTAPDANVPSAFLPGAAADVREAMTGLGSSGRTIVIFRTTGGKICAGLTDFGSGCLDGLPASIPITISSADPDGSGSGEPPLVWGVANNDVHAVNVVVNGVKRPAQLAGNAYFYELPDATMSDRSIESVEAVLSNGDRYNETVDHGPVYTGTTTGPIPPQP